MTEEDELDLRPWLFAIIERWRIVLSLALLLALLAASLTLFIMPDHQATATLLLVSTNSQVTLDERFVTTDPILEAANTSPQRMALIELATSVELARRVVADLGEPELTREDLEALIEQIELATQGDLINIVASAPDQAEALTLAETWGTQYRQMVIEIYSRNPAMSAQTDTALADAQQRYDTAQAAVEAFIASGRQEQLDRRRQSLQNLLDSSLDAAQQLYRLYVQRAQTLDLILQDAQTLREQVLEGNANDFSNALALLSLRSRTNGATGLPIQLNLDDPALIVGGAPTPTDIDALIALLTKQRDYLEVELARVADAIANGEPALTGLNPETSRRYMEQQTALRIEAEQLNSNLRQLGQVRDLALESLSLLKRKQEEQRIVELAPQIDMRLISVSQDLQPSLLWRLLVNSTIGFVFGIVIGIIAALGLAFSAQRRGSVSRPVTTDTAVTEGSVR